MTTYDICLSHNFNNPGSPYSPVSRLYHTLAGFDTEARFEINHFALKFYLYRNEVLRPSTWNEFRKKVFQSETIITETLRII